MADVRNVIDEIPYGVNVQDMIVDDNAMTDMDADDCIKKIDNWEKYRQYWLDYYQKKVDEVNSRCDNNIAWQKRKLRYFFQSVPHRSTKTSEMYDLPSGKLSWSFNSVKMVPDKASILERLRASKETEFIKVKTTEDLDWNGYKKNLQITEFGEVVDKRTGEIVGDVSLETVEGDFTVKTNKSSGGNENESD